MTKGRKKTGMRTIEADPAKLGPLLRECGFVADEGDPVRVTASFDRLDRPRRVHASYANGWRATLSLYVDGTYALSQAFRFRSTIKGAPAPA